MNEADSKRLKEIIKEFVEYGYREGKYDHWLFSLIEAQEGEIEVLTFKVANVTTERDVAWQEIERLKESSTVAREVEADYQNVYAENEKLRSQLTAANAKVEK